MNHPVCKHINSTRLRGTGVREILWNFGYVCLSSPSIGKRFCVKTNLQPGVSPDTPSRRRGTHRPKAGSGGGADRSTAAVGVQASSVYPSGKPAPAGAAGGGGSRPEATSRPTPCTASVLEAVAPVAAIALAVAVRGGGCNPGAPLFAATPLQPKANPLAGAGWVVQTQCASTEVQ